MKNLRHIVSVILFINFIFIPIICRSSNETANNSSSSTTDAHQIIIDPLSARPLYLIQLNGDQSLGMATGFIVQKANIHYLITNWHVVSGRKPETNEIKHPTGITPDSLYIWHHGKQLGTWKKKKESLYDRSGTKRWLEHKEGRKVDVVALPLQNIGDDITLYPFDLSLADVDVVPDVASPISIIGFPLGFTSAGFFPIWKTGHIASEPTLDYQGEPMFLIDATTRGGMSGSPVVFRPNGTFKNKKGSMVIGSNTILFLGVYSGRLSQDSEIGKVWRPRLINEILQ